MSYKCRQREIVQELVGYVPLFNITQIEVIILWNKKIIQSRANYISIIRMASFVYYCLTIIVQYLHAIMETNTLINYCDFTLGLDLFAR